METFDGTYLKKYYCFAFILSAACVICMTLLGIFAFTKDTCSFGIIVLLALSFVLAVLAIISWVALFREKCRYHERIFPYEAQKDSLKEIAAKQEEKEGLVGDIGKLHILEKEKNDLLVENTKLKKKLEELLGKNAGEECEKIKTELIKEFVKKIDEGYNAIIEENNNKRIAWQDGIIAKMSSLFEPLPRVETPEEESTTTPGP